MTATQYIGQALCYIAFISVIGYFSSSPSYTHLDPNLALIKLAFNHAGKLKERCRELTEEELAKKPKHLRKKFDCPRERSPIYVVLDLNGNRIFEQTIEPSGLANDLPSPLYEKFVIPKGNHHLYIGLRDHIDTKEFDYEAYQQVDLVASQILVIGFDPSQKRFTFN